MADPRQERQACAHDSRSGGAVSGGAGSAGVSQATDGEIHSRLGIRRQQTGQHLQRSGMLQPGASSQIAAGFGECDGRHIQGNLPDDARAEAGERDAELSVRYAAIAGMAAVYGSGGDGRSGGSGAGAAADQNV